MISLKSKSTRATINPDGGWVEALTSKKEPILFAKTVLASDSGDQKTRGGMHVCLPNFGPGGDSGLAQHGFGRTMPWKVIGHNRSSVTMSLQGLPPRYGQLVATLSYTVAKQGFEAKLTIRNTGGTSFRVAPGFHPYFSIDESDNAVSVNDATYELANLAGTEFIGTQSVVLQTSTKRIQLDQQNLSLWAVWSDRLANYVCVEPTYGGYRFLNAPMPDEYILPNTEKIFSCTISW